MCNNTYDVGCHFRDKGSMKTNVSIIIGRLANLQRLIKSEGQPNARGRPCLRVPWVEVYNVLTALRVLGYRSVAGNMKGYCERSLMDGTVCISYDAVYAWQQKIAETTVNSTEVPPLANIISTDMPPLTKKKDKNGIATCGGEGLFYKGLEGDKE